ncbi:restriction endonuclease subunit S [Pasteurella sp. 22655_41Tandhals]|uniref:restriction endonuclease subunit S n=1 Tax=Pasteurella sp. 22655_41Tandhals TaxID=3416655 RepID=UPI003CE8E0B9
MSNKSKLSDFISIKHGFAFKGEFISTEENENCLLTPGNFAIGGGFKSDKFKFYTGDVPSDYILNSDDLIVTMTDLSKDADTLGYSALVPNIQNKQMLHNQRIGLVIFINDELDKEYLYFLMRSKEYRHHVVSTATGSTVKHTSPSKILSFEFDKPTLEQQKKIAKYLLSFENKIQLNTQTNQTLEQIAQAIFKSWFVDFDPVKAKIEALANGGTKADAERAAMQIISGKTDAELTQMQQTNPDAYKTLEKTAALFPSEMVESELGEVPKGWGVTNFGSVSVCFDNQRIPLSKQQREKKKGSIPYYGATSIMDYVDEAIFNGIYLLMGEDGSVIKNDGTPFLQYIWGRSWINNHAHVLQGKGSVSTEHLMLFLSCTNISAYVTGAVQLKLNQKNMNSIPFLLATDDVNSLFYEKIKFLYEKIRANSEENDFLIKIRDSLLPKLLSGDLG